MPREIQDSDDDFDVTSPTSDGAPSPGNKGLQNGLSTTARDKSTNETSSTDILRREIQKAQQQLVGSSPRVPLPTSGCNDLPNGSSSPLQTNKRRKTTDLQCESTLEKKNQRRKTIKTYGSSSKRVHDLLPGDGSDFESLREHDTEDRTSTGGVVVREEVDRVIALQTWDLPATIQEDFVQHDPSMFPEPSSTIPDNPLSQQRLIQEALLANQMLPPVNQHLPEPSGSIVSSIPWSTYLATQSAQSQTPIQNRRTIDMPPPSLTTLTPGKRSKSISGELDSSHRRDGSPVPLVNLNKPSASLKSDQVSSQPRRTKTLGYETSLNGSPGGSADELTLIIDQNRGIGEIVAGKLGAEDLLPVKGKRPRLNSQLSIDKAAPAISELLLPESPKVELEKQGRKKTSQSAEPSKQTRKKKELGEALEIDDLAIDLPTEQYKPRPSRSRSNRHVQEDPINYSVRPERAANRRAKRRKTTNDVSEHLIAMSEVEKISFIGDMGFTPNKTRAALNDTSGNVQEAIDRLLNRPPSRDEDLPIKLTTSDLILKEEVAQPLHTVDLVSVEILQKTSRLEPLVIQEDADMHHRSSRPSVNDENEQPTLPAPPYQWKAQASSSISKRRHTEETRRRKVVDSDAEEIEEELDTDPPELERKASIETPRLEETNEEDAPTIVPSKETKRGRGRPRKVVNSPINTEAPKPKARRPEPVRTTINTTPTPDLGPPTEDTSPVPYPSPPKAAVMPPPSTPEQRPDTMSQTQPPKGDNSKSATHHSPISKSKVPYRVGLSRRTRIAPLLKVMKK